MGNKKKASVKGSEGVDVRTVEVCQCTNDKLERGETCGQPNCPNLPMHERHAREVVARIADLDYYEDKTRTAARRTHSESYTNGDGETVWRILDKSNKVLTEEVADEELMKVNVVLQRIVFKEKADVN